MAGQVLGNAGAWMMSAVTSLVYVAISSRIFSPTTVGAYASSVLAEIVTYLAIGSGLVVGIQRRSDLSSSDEHDYLGRALLAGLAAAAVMLVGADAWASLWSTPESVTLTRGLAAAALLHPLWTVCTGILRRHGRHHAAAVAIGTAGVLSSVIGIIPVLVFGTPITLIVSNILIAPITIVVCARQGVQLRARFSRKLADGRVVSSTVLLNLANYVAYNGAAWSVSRFISVATLGLYSRTWLLADLPAQGLATAASQVLFPSFSRMAPEEARRPASDAIVSVSALTALALAGLSALSSLVVAVVLGHVWFAGVPLLAVLAIALTALPPQWLLAAQLQGQARFRSLAVSRTSAIATVAVFAGLVATSGSAIIAAVGAGAVQVSAHCIDIRAASLRGLVDAGALVRGYGRIALACLPLWLIGALQAAEVWSPRTAGPLLLLCAATAVASVFTARGLLRGPLGAALQDREVLPAWIGARLR